MSINLDLLERARSQTDDLIQLLTALKYQHRWNSDENISFESYVAQLKMLSLILDGTFHRFDSNTDIVRESIPKSADSMIKMPVLLDGAKR